MRRIKAIVYGVGEMGKIMTRFMVEKGVIIVGAIGHESNVGKDLGEVAGLGYPLNVKISDNADEVLSQQGADIAVLAIYSQMERMYPLFKRCIESGVNVITTCDEALYPWTTSPELTSNLDKLAKRYNVTITGGGFQDVFLSNIIILLSGASHTIESITGQQKYNLADYGPMTVEWRHIGETKDQFYHRMKEQSAERLDLPVSLETICAGLGLTVKKIKQSREPITEDVDIQVKNWGITVKKGLIVGHVEITEIETEQGIKLRGEETSKVYKEGEVDINKWIIKGVPDTYLANDRVVTRLQTCTCMVNRIPDIINSEPGYITVDTLPMLKFRAFPLQYYLKNSKG
jgi:4-hydroxy-tetrahydrodipicolinate reductase